MHSSLDTKQEIGDSLGGDVIDMCINFFFIFGLDGRLWNKIVLAPAYCLPLIIHNLEIKEKLSINYTLLSLILRQKFSRNCSTATKKHTEWQTVNILLNGQTGFGLPSITRLTRINV